MLVRFKNAELERVAYEYAFTNGYPSALVSAFRGRVQVMHAAPQEHSMLQLKSLQMERLKDGTGQHEVRVTDDWNLIVAFEDGSEGRVAVVEAMVNRTIINMEHPS